MNHVAVLAAACLVASSTAVATTANAATLIFTGTRGNVDSPGLPSARCGAQTTISIRNSANSTSTGTSNFGAFDPTLSHCIQLPVTGPYTLGEFLFNFAAGNTLTGTYDGTLTFNAPGVFNNLQNYVVTGGSGMFAGASGSFTGTGTLSFLGQAPTGTQTFRGSINVPGVPEPASWLLMITGFGAVGGALRRGGAVRRRAMAIA